MKTTKNQNPLYKEKDLRLLLNDTWSLIEELNTTQLLELVKALENVRMVIQYAVKTGMKEHTEHPKVPVLRNLSNETVFNHFQNDKSLHFSGKY